MRVTVLGPVYPYRGGIAHHTTLLARHLAEQHELQLISLRRQYPRWLVGGRSDRDPSQLPLSVDADYLLDPLNPITWWQVAARVRAWQPDLIVLPWWVSFWAPAWLALVRLARRQTRARIVFLCHNVVPHEGGRISRLIARVVLGQGDGLLAQSRSQAELLQHLLPGHRVAWSLHPSYAELATDDPVNRPDRQAARAQLGCAGQPLLLFFGFVRPYKGLPVLLDALQLVLRQQAVRLLVVGEIWGGRTALTEQIARNGLAEHVTLVDRYVPNEEIAQFFSAADVVVLPYLSATQSGVIPLAFSFGVPVIASEVGGLADAVTHGETGLLVPPGDPAALAEAILRFLSDDLRPVFAANIGSDQGRFTWDRMIACLETLAGAETRSARVAATGSTSAP